VIVDTRNPEVGDALKRWFEARDELFEIRSSDNMNAWDNDRIGELEAALVDIGDELVAFLCPTLADRAQHTGETLEPPPPLTELQMDKALHIVAEWLGGRMRDDGKPCPTGRVAAFKSQGPMLVPGWAFLPSDPARPTIILEGGPEDWAYFAQQELQDRLGRLGVHSEAYACYALQLYPRVPLAVPPQLSHQ